jgi:hypothetical protein
MLAGDRGRRHGSGHEGEREEEGKHEQQRSVHASAFRDAVMLEATRARAAACSERGVLHTGAAGLGAGHVHGGARHREFGNGGSGV